MADWIPTQAAAIAGCVIPQTIRRKAVGALVKDNADQRSYRLNLNGNLGDEGTRGTYHDTTHNF